MKRVIFILLTAIIFIGSTQATEGTTVVKADYMLGNFYRRAYLDSYEVKPQSYTSSGDNATKPIANAFDNDWVNVWRSASGEVEQSITIELAAKESISKIIYGLQERNPYPTGHGYAQTIKVYASPDESGNDFTLHCSLQSTWSSDKRMFVLPTPVEAKRLKFVFENIYSTTPQKACVEVAELKVLRDDTIFDHVMRMFADEEQTTLNEAYRDDALLDSLETMTDGHIARNYLVEKIRRAKSLLQGEMTADAFPFEVKVYQKAGPDNEKYVLTLFSDKYTYFDKEKFYSEAGGHIERFFDYEPFKSTRDNYNVYLIFTPSNETSASGFDVIDSYFQTYITNPGDGGSTRLCMLTQTGRDRINNLIDEFNEKYLDAGGKIHTANIAISSATYGGAGHTFNNGIKGAVYTTGAGAEVLVHELGHTIGDLSDEYCYMLHENTNLTAESDGFKSRWAEFMYFRYVRHVHLCSGYYRPSAFCMMEITSNKFCEVCKLGLFEKVNEIVADKDDWYFADPVVYYDYTSAYPYEISDINAFYGNNHNLQFRTVAKNFTGKAQTVVANFKITNADGTVNRFVCAPQEYTLAAGELKSITATTSSPASGIMEGDKIVATVTDKATGKVLVDYSTHKKTNGTLVTNYYIGDGNTTTYNEVIATRGINYPDGTEVNISAPDIYGYIYKGSSSGGSITIQKDVTSYITHYYVKERGKVTLLLLDENNTELQRITRSVKYGEVFTPSQSDFAARDGYTLILPDNSTAYDGINDIELTYKLSEESFSGVETGKFYRLKDSEGNYLTSTAEGETLAMSATADNTSIFWLNAESELLSFSAAQYLNTFDGGNGGLEEVGHSGNAVEFTKGTTDGTVKIAVAEGSYLYSNATTATAGATGTDWVTEEVEALSVTIDAVGYSTLYSPVALKIPGDVTAYVATYDGEYVNLSALQFGVIPAHTAVILEAEEGTYTFTVTGDIELSGDNVLLGTMEKIPASDVDSPYTLQTEASAASGVIMRRYSDTYIKGFKMYMSIPDESLMKLSFRFPGSTTGVENVAAEGAADTVVYDLFGRKIDTPTKGLYIINGKKVVVR